MKYITKILAVTILVGGLPTLVSAATMSVSPASQSVKVGDTFTVSIKLDTQGQSIDGVDIRYLSFNPGLLQVEDTNAATAGTQITAESLMALTVLNNVDNQTGKISFSQVATGGTKYKGSGILATIKFKAIAAGTAALTFDHAPGKTTDTNVAASGSDILSGVANGSFTIGAGNPLLRTTPPKTTTVTPPSGSALPEDAGAPLPESDNSEFVFSEKKSFWQIIVALFRDAISSFGGRVDRLSN
jgi:hypothetical protein